MQSIQKENPLPDLVFSKQLKGMLADKVGIVTGASRGIGAASARAFVEAGAKVALAARDRHALEEIANSINSEHEDTAVAIPTDVSDVDSVNHLITKTVESFGRLDFAFNNAGGGPMPALLADLSAEDFDFAMDVNVRGTFLFLKFEIPAMIKGGAGTIVNMSSTAGLQGVRGIGAYVTAKHGVIGLTRAAALDYAKQNIRVNVVAPGPIYTEHLANLQYREQAAFGVPMGRVGNREEVANVVAWLCSDLSSFVTGAMIPIDGGRLSGTWFGPLGGP
ncbi:MAG: SDR family oxidoreductase [Thaumarchaeota archaeon]|nr:SDR family oxidoreductase [Nitrososphaerota archaeon]